MNGKFSTDLLTNNLMEKKPKAPCNINSAITPLTGIFKIIKIGILKIIPGKSLDKSREDLCIFQSGFNMDINLFSVECPWVIVFPPEHLQG